MEMIIALIMIAGSVAYVACDASAHSFTYNEAAKALKGKMFTY